MSIDIMKQALEALEEAVFYTSSESWSPSMTRECEDAITALRAAIEQAQETVAWMNPSWIDPDTRGWASDSFESIQIEGWIPLYTAPRQWQGLTPSEITAIELSLRQYHDGDRYDLSLADFANAIEAKLKEKNT